MISIFIIVMLASVVIFALVIVLGVFIIKKNINDAKNSNQTQMGYQPTNNQNYINGNFNGGYNYQITPIRKTLLRLLLVSRDFAQNVVQ